MLTVSISINGKPLYAKSARRQEDEPGDNTYKTDAGDIIEHKYDDGIVVLAKKMLDTIEEDF